MGASHPLGEAVAYRQLPGLSCGDERKQTRIALSDPFRRRAGPVMNEPGVNASDGLVAILHQT
jgi:hypothetical protein